MSREIRVGSLRAWPASMFTRSPGLRWPVHPVDGSPDPWAAGVAGDAPVHGDWFLDDDGVPTPGAQKPVAIYADIEGMAHRMIRNPAYHVLAAAGVIPDRNHATFLDRVSFRTDEGRVLFDPDDPETPTGALRRAVDAAVLGPDGRLVPEARDELAAAGELADVWVPDDEALGLFRNPWDALEQDNALAIQVFALDEGPQPGALVFE